MLQDIGIAEVMLAPESKSIGASVAELDLASAFDVTALAVRHRGHPVNRNLFRTSARLR